jgi:hypothetical protein
LEEGTLVRRGANFKGEGKGHSNFKWVKARSWHLSGKGKGSKTKASG